MKAQTPWRVNLQNGQLVTESENLSLQAGAGPKTGGEQGKKSDERRGFIVDSTMIS